MSDELTWHHLGEPEGGAWRSDRLAHPYDRLPREAEATVPPKVWALSRESAGLSNRFRTSARSVSVRWSLREPMPAAGLMTACARGGVDLYAREAAGAWRWAGSAAPSSDCGGESVIVAGLDGSEHDYLLYLPLRSQLSAVEVGVDDRLEVATEADAPPVVYYGTSIVHGVAASRPGLALPALLTRQLGRRVINLGFSGNGRMEVAIAELLAEVEAAAYVVDCIPNMLPEQVAERARPFVERLRAARPDTPILLVEGRIPTTAWLRADHAQRYIDAHYVFRAVFDDLARTDAALHYLASTDFLGADGDGTVDGSHPTDLGFHRMAHKLAPAIAGVLA